MHRYVYFDFLDTDRTAIPPCGWTPVFPQTYGLDSVALLSYGAEESFEGASFRWLLVPQLARESIGTVEYDVASQSGANPKPQKPHLRRPARRTASS